MGESKLLSVDTVMGEGRGGGVFQAWEERFWGYGMEGEPASFIV